MVPTGSGEVSVFARPVGRDNAVSPALSRGYVRLVDRPPGVPAEFDVRTVVFLVRADDPPELADDELDDLQREHLAYGFSLAERGITVANGPMREQSDERLRGMSVYTVGRDEALRIAGLDPMVQAGWLRVEVARWCVAAGKVAFPRHPEQVGDVVAFEHLDDIDDPHWRPDPEWHYVNLRRYLAYLEHSIDDATQWAVFEPNDDRLWDQVRRSVGDVLQDQWRSGRLLGERADQAFFVRCDRTTMTQADLDNGRLVVEIGVAPVRPAEFVVFRIGQWTASGDADPDDVTRAR
ncbi:hypothetical protein GCM10023145_09740 [Angustibacter luteus]